MQLSPTKRPALFCMLLWWLSVVTLALLRGWTEGIERGMGFVLAVTVVSGCVVGSCLLVARADGTARGAALGVVVAIGLIVLGGTGWRGMASYLLLCCAGTLFLSVWVGVSIGRRVPHARFLWPLVIVAVAMAVWVAWMPDGFSHRLLFERPPKSSLPLTYLTVPFPGGSHESVLGLGDVVFTGLLLGVVERAGLSTKRAVLGVFLGFAVSVYVHLETALLLPSLVYVGPAAALALGRTVKPRWTELAHALAFVPLACGVGYWIQL